MKNITLYLVMSALLATLGCTSCKKTADPEPDNPYGLPKATQTGVGIFACRVNGENWIVENSIYTLGGG